MTLVNVSGPLADGTAAWGTHTGSYTVPAGQTTTRFGFQAVSTATGNQSVGNLLAQAARYMGLANGAGLGPDDIGRFEPLAAVLKA